MNQFKKQYINGEWVEGTGESMLENYTKPLSYIIMSRLTSVALAIVYVESEKAASNVCFVTGLLLLATALFFINKIIKNFVIKQFRQLIQPTSRVTNRGSNRSKKLPLLFQRKPSRYSFS